MTVPFLPQFEDRFLEIDEMKEPTRSKRLAILMTDMEGVYDIPLSGRDRDNEFTDNNPEVMTLYKKVSMAREF
ncbi:hypothetical protein ACFSTA_12355 [Ornithinibacillus salinisoli]|uniref:Uncharacterized protein n=1 Tax=Ornithinibacillus salinisoli TaxID=1848459 RepID=A0ABW4W5I1_9BACI